MPEQIRATLAIFLVLIIMFLSLTISDKQKEDEKNPVATDEPVYSEIQHSALRADDELDFGLTLKASDVTNTGLTLTCEQSGGAFEGELATGAQYALDKLDGTKWIVCDTLVPEEEIAWTMEAYLVDVDGTVTWDVDWSPLYGELAAGSYRISKTFNDASASNTYFAYFTVK